ncbi:MAG: hypothetical protein ABJB16_10240 [Saprospiraceae bacterium]
MNKFYILYLFCLSINFCSCDLERIELGSGSETKFSTTVGSSGDDYPSDMIVNTDGSIVIVGTSKYNNTSSAYLVKLDKNGNQLWEKNLGGLADSEAHAVIATSDGGYILCGSTVVLNIDLYVVKVNSLGTEVWSKSYGAADSIEVGFGLAVIGTNDLMIGYTSTLDLANKSVRFMRLNSNGSRISDKLGITRASFFINEMIKTTDNKMVIVGSQFVSTSTSYIAKFMEDGGFIWEQNYSGPIDNYAPGYGVVEMPDKSLFLAGSYLGNNDHDFLVVNYSEIGMEVIDKSWGGANPDELMSITNTQDGEIVVLGYTQSFSTTQEIYLSKRKKSDGSEIWAKHFSETWGNSGGAVRLCPDGGFALCTRQDQGDADIIVIKTDANGNYQ